MTGRKPVRARVFVSHLCYYSVANVEWMHFHGPHIEVHHMAFMDVPVEVAALKAAAEAWAKAMGFQVVWEDDVQSTTKNGG